MQAQFVAGMLYIMLVIIQLCLNAKCHAIRDAQVVEKRTTDKEYKADEKRLDDMMEQDRINAIKTQEEMEELRKQTRYA